MIKDIAVNWDKIRYTCKECDEAVIYESIDGYFKIEDIVKMIKWTDEHKHSNGFKINSWKEND